MRLTYCVVSLPLAALLATALVHERPRNPNIEPDHSIEAALKVPPQVQTILRRACYDCHSSETRWPWYSTVSPLSGIIQEDVLRAREVMNFSEWTITAGASPARAAGSLNAMCAAVQTGIMPKPRYRVLHPEAKLSPSDVNALCEWAHTETAALASLRKRRAHPELTTNLRSANNPHTAPALP